MKSGYILKSKRTGAFGLFATPRNPPSPISQTGKEREFAAARSCAVWPDATDEELSQEPEALKAALLARLPALLEEFQQYVESLGFVF